MGVKVIESEVREMLANARPCNFCGGPIVPKGPTRRPYQKFCSQSCGTKMSQELKQIKDGNRWMAGVPSKSGQVRSADELRAVADNKHFFWVEERQSLVYRRGLTPEGRQTRNRNLVLMREAAQREIGGHLKLQRLRGKIARLSVDCGTCGRPDAGLVPRPDGQYERRCRLCRSSA